MQHAPEHTDNGPHQDTRPAGGFTRHALRGMFWLLSSSTSQSGMNVLVTAVLARLLTPADFGLVAAALLVVGLVEIIHLAGIGPALVQRKDVGESHIRSGFTFSLLLGVLMSGLICWLAPWIARLFKMPELTVILRALSIVFPIHAVAVVSRNLILRSLRFSSMAGIEALSYLIGYGGAGVLLAWRGWGVWALVAAHLAHAGVQSALLFIVQPHRISLRMERWALKDLLLSSGGFTLAEFVSYISARIDRLVTGRWLGAEALGVYSRASAIDHVLIRLPARVAGHVLFPSFAKVQHERDRLGRVFRHALGVAGLLILQVSVLTFVLAEEMVAVLLGSQWMSVVLPLRILSLVMVFNMHSRLANIVARSCGDVYRLSGRKGIFAVAMFLGAWIGHFRGVPGVAACVSLVLILNALMGIQQCILLRVLTWREWMRVLRQALWPALVVAPPAAAAAGWLRGLGAHPGVTLFAVLALAAIVFALLLFLGPPRLIGRNGAWFLHYVNTFWPISFVRNRVRLLEKMTGE